MTQCAVDAVVLLMVLASMLAFLAERNVALYAPIFVSHALFLYAVISVCQFGLVLAHSAVQRSVCIVVQAVAAVLIGYPLGHLITGKALLYGAIVVNVGVRFPPRLALCCGVVFSIFTTSLQRPTRVWDVALPGPGPLAVAAMATVQLAFLLLAIHVNLMRRAMTATRQQALYLQDTVSQLNSAVIGFQEYADTVFERSVNEERKRISRDLHDSVGYALTNIRMMMEEAIGLYDGTSDQMVSLIVQTRDQARHTLQETRTILQELRRISVDSDMVDLRALLRIARVFESATRIKVKIDISNCRRSYGSLVDRCIYRLLQESMTNAFKHGRATLIEVYLFEDQDTLRIYVRDNGAGCAVVQEGIGITGMRERLAVVRGSIEYPPVPNGFGVMVEIPIGNVRQEGDDGANQDSTG